MIHHSQHNPDPEYIKILIKAAGCSQAHVYTSLGINPRTWRNWMSKSRPSGYSYCVQVAVEKLLEEMKK